MNRIVAYATGLLMPLFASASQPLIVQAHAEHASANALLERVAREKVVFSVGPDSQNRPAFVGSQAALERLFAELLAKKEIVRLVAAIHTPAPATPLCMEGKISKGLVNPSILLDPARLRTVTERPDLVRALLQAGAELTAVFPAKGLELRSPEQLKIYHDLKQRYPNLKEIRLVDLPPEMTGATYWIERSNGEKELFSIMSYQANDPTDGIWAIWYGSLRDPEIQSRADDVAKLLH